MSRAVLRCQACRYSLLDAFTSLAGVSLSSQRTLHSFSPIQNRALPRPIHTTARRLQSIQAEKSENDADVETQPSTESDAPQSEAQPVPWYLEIDNPEPPAPMTSPILARQQIPPLPSNPPAVLPLVLNHLSTSIGLDDLTLLDLRTLSPPPALGANLLMIIGTARSVKHLNVSADRFCRWLRTNYKLRPYADGLLGRNELKLKLRRKARRLKLERAAGRQSEHNADDGITTGWVCVNVGPVDQVEIPTSTTTTTAESDVAALNASEISEDIDEDEDGEEYINPEALELDEHDLLAHAAPPHDVDASYVGFGSRATSQRIVVQMFTEEKRAEMNLEELWNARNTRMLRREEKAEKRVEYVLKQREGEEMRRRMERVEAQKEKGALGGVMEEGDGEDVKEMLERLEGVSVQEKEKEELRRRIETLRRERGEAAEKGEEVKEVKEDPKWSPIFNVKPRP